MADSRRWSVEFFRDRDGSLPVAEWLDSLAMDVRAKVASLIEKLAEHGPNLEFPYSSQIEGRLRELRTQVGKTRYRILYCFDAHRTGVLLHGFAKNTTKTPEADKQLGMRRLLAHFERVARRSGK